MTHVFAMFQFLPLAKEGLRRFCAFINDPKGRGERGIEDVRAPLTIDAAAKL